MDINRTFARLQDYYWLCLTAFWSTFRRPFYIDEAVEQMRSVGVGSVLLVLLVSLFIGMALSLETSSQLALLGLGMYTGNIVGLSIITEIGPVSIGLAFAGRVGSGMASELGSMAIRHQVDVLRVFGIDPIKRLVIPRILACLITLPLLTIVGDAVSILGGYYIAVFERHQSASLYWTQIQWNLTGVNILSGLLKPVFFGFLIASISCFAGLSTSGGAKGLRHATMQSVVISSIAIIIADFLIARALQLLGLNV